MAYKGSGKKAKIQGSGQKRSSFVSRVENLGAPKPKRKSKGQDSRKVHDAKGKNNHGRTKW
ncbi:MAG TPA: hypothetical protein VFH06_02300 [Candidatus Saccharimonadales bacterium]|nr:hypothetical protein [Candidatus Saccharimonadales bacterium]